MNKLILYRDDIGRVSVSTCIADEDVWLTQEQQMSICLFSKLENKYKHNDDSESIIG